MVKMLVVVLLLCLSTLGPVPAIRLDGNGYTGILVVINPRVPENQEIINQIKDMIRRGSEYLFEALDRKVYFKEVNILVPPEWRAGTYDRAGRESYIKGKIVVDEAHSAFGDEPFTLQAAGCGKEALYTHFTPNFLLNQNLIHVYGPKGRVFVHEWAHLRWGVFDEYDTKQPFYISGGQILPTRCTEKISGQWFEVINQRVRPCQGNGGMPSSSCEFFPDVVQNTNASIMYTPSLDSITAFCDEKEHNIDAPNEQNRKCKKSTRGVIFEGSVDGDALRTLTPLQSPPPPPAFRVLKRGVRVVCLVLDVSGSMEGSKIIIQQQAAAVLIKQLREGVYVGLVTFSTNAVELSPLTLIDGPATQDTLINKLPVNAAGSTNICKGLRKGLEVLRADDSKAIGDEIIFLTDGMATDNVQDCLQEAVQSGATINTIAFGNSADGVLKTMADETEGKFVVAPDSTFANQLVDAFSSMTMFDGNFLTQPVQLESTGEKTAGWFNGTVTIDRSVGNRTTFTITYETSAPSVYVQSPSGLVYDQRNTSDIARTITLTIPATAEPGDWKYSFLSKGTVAQAITLIVVSQAAHEDVYPVTVTARMDQQTSDGQTPLLVMAEVSQNYYPVLGASVWANLLSDNGQSVNLELLDNGAGADARKDDGIYSRYFTKLIKGKYSLRLKVVKQQTGVQSAPYTHSGVLYVPGYIVDGRVELNPPKPPVNVQPVDVGSFTRTVTGDSFVVAQDLSVNFPPNQITDLTAELQEDIVLLNWSAPGADLDEGTAESYEIRWSEDLKMLQNNFGSAHQLNTSAFQPKVAGSAEGYTFQPNVSLQNGATLFIAIQSEDQQNKKSDVSNVARVTKYILTRRPSPISNQGLNLPVVVVAVCGVTILACVIAVIVTWAVRRRRYYSCHS